MQLRKILQGRSRTTGRIFAQRGCWKWNPLHQLAIEQNSINLLYNYIANHGWCFTSHEFLIFKSVCVSFWLWNTHRAVRQANLPICMTCTSWKYRSNFKASTFRNENIITYRIDRSFAWAIKTSNRKKTLVIWKHILGSPPEITISWTSRIEHMAGTKERVSKVHLNLSQRHVQISFLGDFLSQRLFQNKLVVIEWFQTLQDLILGKTFKSTLLNGRPWKTAWNRCFSSRNPLHLNPIHFSLSRYICFTSHQTDQRLKNRKFYPWLKLMGNSIKII